MVLDESFYAQPSSNKGTDGEALKSDNIKVTNYFVGLSLYNGLLEGC
jgi:hypothetical protein